MYVSSGEPPWRRRQALIMLLVFVLGLGGGFVAAQFVGQDDDRIPDEDLVLFESAGTTFPIEGAQFTASTYDVQTQQCDKEALKRLLRADRRRFDAWLELQGITESQFDTFVDRLVTRILTEATPVTNHGCFADGPCPFEVQSVLAAGTPVWFDPSQDRVVAKCTCSNPLKAPKCPPNCGETVSPSPSPSPTPTTSATPTATATATATPTPLPLPTAPPTNSPSPSPSPSPTPSPVP